MLHISAVGLTHEVSTMSVVNSMQAKDEPNYCDRGKFSLTLRRIAPLQDMHSMI